MQRSQVIGLVLVALALGFVIGFKSGKGSAPGVAPDARGPAETVADGAVAPGLPRLVDLGSTTCTACKQMAPILEELRTELRGKVRVEFIDVNENVEAVNEYNIQVIPTQIFIDAEGQEVLRHEGFFAKADILAQLQKMGVRVP
jgi:thioredoxin 1